MIQRFDGYIAQHLGDGLLMYFGWPRAHENDAQRALHSGLGIVEAITTNLNPRLEAEKGVQLTVRLGVHTGPVVVGKMGSDGRQESLATGETVNIAARLEGLAEPNTVVISSVTERLVRGAFTLEDLGPHVLKGVIEPMKVFHVLRLAETQRDEDENLPDGGVFLVGRDEEVGLLLRRWEQSKEGLGQVVLISGEAGIGKSSLVATVRAHVLEEGYTRITFRCSPYHTNSALYPVIIHLEQMLGFDRDDTPGTKLDKLEQALRTTGLSLEESVPLVAALLSVHIDDHYPALTLSPQQQRQQTLDTLVAWLIEESEKQSVLAVWEDLHWADPSTLEMLGLMVDQSPTAAILNLLTFRPEFPPPWPSRSHTTPVTLNRLERPQVEALITHLAGDKALPGEVVEHVVSKTDGVPLYVEELTKMLLASDVLQAQTDQYVLTGPLSAVTIPDTLQDSLMARLDQLGVAKETAQLGAVLGREFSYEMIETLSSQDESTLQVGLDHLVQAELLYHRGRVPRSTYTFKHALIQDAAYGSLLKSTRQRVHQQIAELLEAQFPELVENQPELLAHHWAEANQSDAALQYWEKAGQRAYQRSDYVETIAHFTQGLAVLATLPEGPERLRQELDLQVTLGAALRNIQGYGAPDVERAYRRARELCQLIGDTPQVLMVMRGLTIYYWDRGQLQTACPLAEELLYWSQSQTDPVFLMLAHHIMGCILFMRGEPASAHTHHTQALSIYTPEEFRSLPLHYGENMDLCFRTFLAWQLWQLGYPDQAVAQSQEAITVAQDVAHPFRLAQCFIWGAALQQYRLDGQAAHEQAIAGATLAHEQGFANWMAWGTILLGWALAVQGQSEAGITEIRQGIDARLEVGAKGALPYFLGLLAEAYGESGHIEEGLNAVSEALAVMDTTEERFYGAELYRLKGVLLLKQAVWNASEAATCFQQAIDIARQQEAKSWELRAATSLARLWQQQDKRQDAYDLLTPIYNWFTEGFDTADLKDAKVLLDALAAVCQRPRT